MRKYKLGLSQESGVGLITCMKVKNGLFNESGGISR